MASAAEQCGALKAAGNNFFQNNQHEQAVDLYTQALALIPDEATILSNRAASYTVLQKFEDALKDAEEVIRIRPTWPRGYLRKGAALFMLQKYKEASEAYEIGLQHDINDLTLKKCLAIARTRLTSKGFVHIYAWGCNTCGNLGGDPACSITIPVKPAIPGLMPRGTEIPYEMSCMEGKGVVNVACGKYHSALVTTDGVVYTMGRQWRGALGRGGAQVALRWSWDSVPAPISLGRAIQVACGYQHTLVLTEGGNVYGFGCTQSCGLPSQKYGWVSSTPRRVEALALSHAKIVKIAACHHQSAALNDRGEAITWGNGGRKILGHAKASPEVLQIAGSTGRFVSITVGLKSIAVIDSAGDIHFVGGNENPCFGVLRPVAGEAKPMFTQMALGRSNRCYVSAAVTSRGALYVWGGGTAAAPAVMQHVSELKHVVEVGAGKGFIACLCANGEIHTMGHGGFGELGYRVNNQQDRELDNVRVDATAVAPAAPARRGPAAPAPPKPVPFRVKTQPYAKAIVKDFYPVASTRDFAARITHLACGAYNVIAISEMTSPPSLAADLKCAMVLEEFCDLAFIVDGAVFNCHQCVIFARCRPLHAFCIANGTKKASDEKVLEVVVPSVQKAVFAAFLHFLYSDELIDGFDLKLCAEAKAFADSQQVLSFGCVLPALYHPPADVVRFTLAPQLKSLCNKQDLSDVAFSVAGSVFHAHKCILTARSEYFRTMLLGSMREAKEAVVTLREISAETFGAILEYIYTDLTTITAENSVELVIHSNLFGLDRLKRMASAFIAEALDEANVLNVLFLADRYDAFNLKRTCISFIKRCDLKVLQRQEDWQHLTDSLKEDIYSR